MSQGNVIAAMAAATAVLSPMQSDQQVIELTSSAKKTR